MDLTSDDEIGSEQKTATDLANQFLHPGYHFKGMALRPTRPDDLLFNQVLDRNDAPFTSFMSFIFLHLHPRSQLVVLCWDKLKYREALLDWIDSLGHMPIRRNRGRESLRRDPRLGPQKFGRSGRSASKKNEGETPSAIACVIEIFGGKFTKEQIPMGIATRRAEPARARPLAQARRPSRRCNSARRAENRMYAYAHAL